MNSQILKLISECSEVKLLKTNPQTHSIIVTGSVTRDDFVDGWSDIDIIVVLDNPSIDFFQIIDQAVKSISSNTSLKTGVVVVDSEILRLATNNVIPTDPLVKVAISLSYLNKYLNNGILYNKESYVLPTFSASTLYSLSASKHALETSNYMYTFLQKSSDYNNKDIMRKIIKNSIFMMQIFNLVKENSFTYEYDSILDHFESVHNLNLKTIKKYYSRRQTWSTLKHEEISRDEIGLAFEEFKSIRRNNLK